VNKAELSILLEQKVQEKIRNGYSITTYALDAASRDRVKRSLKPLPHHIDHHENTAEEWQDYLSKVEAGTYQPERTEPVIDTAPANIPENDIGQTSSGSVGQWKARRH
jgi:hypothetical protein